MNPCKQCIVKAMCQESCSSLLKYLKISLKSNSRHVYSEKYLRFVATLLRKRKAELWMNDTWWRLT